MRLWKQGLFLFRVKNTEYYGNYKTLGGKYYEKLSEQTLDLGHLPDRVRSRPDYQWADYRIHDQEVALSNRYSQVYRVI